jgi:hypothetical protein
VAIISNAVTIADAGAFSASLGSLTLIKTITLSSAAGTVSFVHGASDVVLDDTYPIYQVEFINIHPATDGAKLTVGFRDGGTAYDATKTTTSFGTYNREDGGEISLGYRSDNYLTQATGAQTLINYNTLSNDDDSSVSGDLILFNPSSTTFVKHFMSNVNSMAIDVSNRYSVNSFTAGYNNVTAAIDGVQFAMTSGNIESGKVQLYGIKDS